MSGQSFHLAQLNVARLKAPLDSPLMAGFVAQIESIYSVAERAKGFVWRLRDEAGSAALPRAADPLIIVTMSVWETVADLRDYVYRSEHSSPLRNRAGWFERLDEPSLVLWWIPRGSVPRVEQGMARLKYLRRNGPTPRAFTFKECFPPPGEADQKRPDFDDAGAAGNDRLASMRVGFRVTGD